MRHTGYRKFAALVAALLVAAAPAAAQAQQPPQASRPAVLDASAIRRQAAQLAEVRALLTDPDPNVRLLAIREIARSGDAVQRQLAIETGLASAEAGMQEAALRALLSDTKQIVIILTNMDGSPIKDGYSILRFSISKFDPDKGIVDGGDWSGQVQGAVFAFSTSNGVYRGSLVWEAEASEFRGTANVNGGIVNGDRKAVWRVR